MRYCLCLFWFSYCFMCYSQQYVNGNLSTGPISNSGVLAPAGYTWSEEQSDFGVPSITNVQEGFQLGDYYINKFADDFTVPNGETWNIQNFQFYVFNNVPTNPLPVDALRIEIWDGIPEAIGSNKLYGDLTTNLIDIANSGEAYMYDILNSNFSSGSGVGGPPIAKKKYGK